MFGFHTFNGDVSKLQYKIILFYNNAYLFLVIMYIYAHVGKYRQTLKIYFTLNLLETIVNILVNFLRVLHIHEKLYIYIYTCTHTLRNISNILSFAF